MYEWLDIALDAGITEQEFWCMTIAELNRALTSRKRQIEQDAKNRACYDYILADLIGRSVSRIYSKKAEMPKISDIYPNLFDSEELEEKKRKRQAEIFALNLKRFAEIHNTKYEEAK